MENPGCHIQVASVFPQGCGYQHPMGFLVGSLRRHASFWWVQCIARYPEIMAA